MVFADREDLSAALVRGVVLAVWSWVAFAYVAASALDDFASALADEESGRLPPGVREQVGSGDTVDSVASVVAFDFGDSTFHAEPALGVALRGIETTLALFGVALAVAAVLSVGVARLARRGERGRRAVTVLGYAGALPGMAWLLAAYWLDANGLSWLIRPESSTTTEFLVGGVVLALPLVAVAARALVREGRDRGWALDGWLFVSWLLGSVVAVETALGIEGVGHRFTSGLLARDTPLIVACAGVLVVLGLLASVGREVGWATHGSGGHATRGPAADGRVERTDGGVSTAPARAVRGRWRVRAGLAGLGVAVLGALAGEFAFEEVTGEMSLPELALAGLAGTVPDVLWAGCVAVALGVLLGVAAARVDYGRPVGALLLVPATNVPLFVLFWFRESVPGLSAVGADWTTALGLAVAPLVAMRAARDLREDAPVTVDRLLPSVGVGAVGAGVAGFVLVQLPVVGATSNPLFWSLPRHPTDPLVFTLVAVGLPAASLFLLGDGLREA